MDAEENGKAIAKLETTIEHMRICFSDQFDHGRKHLEKIDAHLAHATADHKDLVTTVAVIKAKAEGITIGVKLTMAAGGATVLGVILWVANQVWPGAAS